MSDHFFPRKEVKIAKKRQCWGCADIHEKGTLLTKESGVTDDGYWNAYFCPKCIAFMNDPMFSWNEFEGGIGCGELRSFDEYESFKP